jgi:RNA polymerase sigma-70 factor, ECF subfamily
MSANPVLDRSHVARREETPRERTGVLYERYYDRVFGYCLYKLGNRHEAEDAVQTTFLWVLRGLEHGIEPRMEANWLFTIAQNACRARIRTRGRRRVQETLSDPQILEEVAPGRDGARDELVGLEEALRDMPDLQRQAIILREWRGFSYKEIAAELELSAAAVETLIFRARRSLASRLENPNARPAKRAQNFAFNLGSLGSAFKSFLGLGGATKVAAVAATVAAVGIGVGLPGDTPVRSHPATAPSTVEVQRHQPSAATRPPARPQKPQKLRKHRHASSTAPPGDSAGPNADPERPISHGVVANPVVAQATDTIGSATDLANSAVADVKDVVFGASDVLEPVAPALPPLP